MSGPDPGALGVVDAGAVPAVAAFEVADAAFASCAPLDGSLEGWSVFFGSSGLSGFAFAGMTTVRTPRSCRVSSTFFSP